MEFYVLHIDITVQTMCVWTITIKMKSKYFLHLDINSYFKCEILSYIPGSDFKWLTHEVIKDSNTKTM